MSRWGLGCQRLADLAKQIRSYPSVPSAFLQHRRAVWGRLGWGTCVKGTLRLPVWVASYRRWKGPISHFTEEEPHNLWLNYFSLLSVRPRVHGKFTLLLQRLRIIRRH